MFDGLFIISKSVLHSEAASGYTGRCVQWAKSVFQINISANNQKRKSPRSHTIKLIAFLQHSASFCLRFSFRATLTILEVW